MSRRALIVWMLAGSLIALLLISCGYQDTPTLTPAPYAMESR